MDQPQSDALAPIQLHPPLSPGTVPQARTVWPTVLGVLAIIFGSLGFLQGILSLIGPLIVSHLPNMTAQSGFDPFAGMADWRGWLLIIALLTSLAGATLLIGGLLLLSRRAQSRNIILGWSVGKMLLAVFSSYVGYRIQQAQFASMAQSGNNMAGMQSFMSIFGVVGVFIGVIWAWALPVFMIVWFVRRPVRLELRTWSAPMSPMQDAGLGASGA